MWNISTVPRITKAVENNSCEIFRFDNFDRKILTIYYDPLPAMGTYHTPDIYRQGYVFLVALVSQIVYLLVG